MFGQLVEATGQTVVKVVGQVVGTWGRKVGPQDVPAAGQ